MDVVGIGHPNVDFLSHIKSLPGPNESARLLDYSWQGGGKVSTALVALARLGASCGIMGTVGSDLFGRMCKKDFERHGVDTSRLITDEGCETALALVISEEATRGRNIICNTGTNHRLEPGELDAEYIRGAKFLHLSDSTATTQTAADIARRAGVRVAFDADEYSPGIQAMLPDIDVFVASEFYYKAVFCDGDYEKNCKSLLGLGPSVVVFTLGGKGCVGADAGGFFSEPTFDVPVVDTVGAGDVFHGAFIFGLLQGFAPARAARFANAVSSIKCTRIGGRAAIPDLATVTEFIKTGRIDYSEIDRRSAFYREGIQNVVFG